MSRLKSFNPYTYIENKNYTKIIIVVFVILSVLMKIASALFSLKGWIHIPQFDEDIVKASWFETAVEGTDQLIYFWAFFIIDYIWAFLLLFLVGFYIYKKAKTSTNKIHWFYWGFLVISIIAYLLDCTENTLYLTTKEYPETIASAKVIAYAIALIYFILVAIYYSLKDRLLILRDFISSAWISLLFLVIIGLTLPKAPQLNSIIVDLYYHPFGFVVVLLGLFASFYCIALSHYPTYFLLSKNNNRIGKKKWRITDAVGLFGIIWHSSDSKKQKVERGKSFIYESHLSFLRRAIGVFFYMALFYMIAYTTDTNFDTYVSISGSTIFLLAFFLWWLYELNKKKDAWYIHCKRKITPINYDDPKPENKKDRKPTLHVEIITYVVSLILTIIVHLVLLILLSIFACEGLCPYTYTTVILSLACILLQTITYMYYRTFRSVLKYAFFHDTPAIVKSFIVLRDDSDGKSAEIKENEIRQIFQKNKEDNKSPWFQRIAKTRIAILSNNVIFLKIIAYAGFVNAAFLLIINIWPTIALKVNSIVIILSYFYLFYGAIVIILKHILYYRSEVEEATEKEQELLKKSQEVEQEEFHKIQTKLKEVVEKKAVHVRKRKHFSFTMYIAVLLLVIINFLARFNEGTRNNLFELEQITETLPNTVVDFNTYAKNLPDTRYYIGCYGGGMKANAWTMTVLNALDKNNTLYNKTACLSGASGGTIGLINYSVIKHNIKDSTIKKQAIRKIGTENILAMDLTHVFGRDLLNHTLVPFKDLKGKDRSTGAMKRYAQYASLEFHIEKDNYEFDEEKFKSTSYRHYWHKMYTKKGNRFPILISNTTDISGRQGMAVSMQIKDGTAHDIVYEGAIDILDINGKTLSFYNAVSTTNRFPLISPAATISGKGQFNDGGIYENSGLLSAYKLYQAIDKVDTTAKKKTSVFINIINDKSAYVKSRLDAIMKQCKGKEINMSNEITAILNSVAATEMFPNYIKDKLKLLDRLNTKVSFKSIYLPHRFDFDDVKAIYGEDFKSLDCVDSIHDIITENNNEIRELTKKQKSATNAIIEPEMSRVMAIPAFEFMHSMLQHSSIRETIKELQ